MNKYRSPDDLPTQIPVFPLLGAVLLPRANLPLNVFEPRYLSMIDAVMSGDRVLGIIQPVSDQAAHISSDDVDEALESPEGKSVGLRNVGTVGRVTSYQEVDDGRMVITVTGISRFRLESEVSTQELFRLVKADYSEFADDFRESLGEEDVDREHLLTVLKAYLDHNEMKADWNSISRTSSEFLVNALSVMCPYGPEEKQALLEAADLKTRADVLIALAQMELASGSEGGGTIQ